MIRIVMIYALAAALALIPLHSKAFDEVDVDMPNSGNPKTEMIRITIDKCVTKFEIDKKDFEKFSNDPEQMKKMVKAAIKRTANGCQD